MVTFKVCCLFTKQFILYAIQYVVILFDVNTRSFCILITTGFLSIFSRMFLILLDNTSDIHNNVLTVLILSVCDRLDSSVSLFRSKNSGQCCRHCQSRGSALILGMNCRLNSFKFTCSFTASYKINEFSSLSCFYINLIGRLIIIC